MTKYKFSVVSKGTTDAVTGTEKDENGGIKDYVIQHDLERPKPMVGWFTFHEFRDYLKLIG